MPDVTIQLVSPLEATRWAVVWWVECSRHERLCDDRALAEAYAAAHQGYVIPLANLKPWPKPPSSS